MISLYEYSKTQLRAVYVAVSTAFSLLLLQTSLYTVWHLVSNMMIFLLTAVSTAGASIGSAAQPLERCVVQQLLQHTQLACAVFFEGSE